jgi:hypothetical protein
MRKTLIHHWRHEDGWHTVPTVLLKPGQPEREFLPETVGWFCWVYPADDVEFETWMAVHCPTADYTHRFNSGNPMYTVHITDEAECMLFKLKYND